MTIDITPQLQIQDDEVDFDFYHASGPGGQHVNKAATAVRLRFNIDQSSLPEAVQRRLHLIAAHRINQSGELILTAQEHRSQYKNRAAALNQLVELIKLATKRPRRRRKTRPTRSSIERRLNAKRRHSAKKQTRRRTSYEEY